MAKGCRVEYFILVRCFVYYCSYGIRYTGMKNQMRYIQNLFFDILNDYGQAYIVVRHSENTVIGARGFSAEEKKKGITLVFNQRNYKNLVWSDDGSIRATLGFGVGNKSEKCFLHSDDIMSVFSPDAKIKFDRWDVWEQKDSVMKSNSVSKSGKTESQDEKVVSLDRFRKSKN
jgi:hypothetical protein